MATLVLGVAGAAVGSIFGPVGTMLGRAAGALAGSAIDQRLFGARKALKGARLGELSVQSSTEGAVIPRVYGRMRLSGQIIWATDFKEVKREEEQGGGKGGPSVTTTEYRYYANFAVALCEGPIARVGRIWADGKLLDQSDFTIRVYRGSATQMPDSLIVAKQGAGAPAYRGTAYVVFERMALADFGNRLPQLAFEVFKPVGDMERHVRAVCVIPGTTEFGYDTLPVTRTVSLVRTEAENAHVQRGVSDWTVSIDELQALCPQLEWVTLVVAWFGDDLRAGTCTIRPKVDSLDKRTSGAGGGATWRVAGLTRETATRVSLVDGRPAYGGSPSDGSVLRAIQDLKARGLKVVLAPFVLMDIPAGSGKADPEGRSEQPAYPWRGGITCIPAPGRTGSPDGTAAAATAVASFLGTAAPSDFTIADGRVVAAGGTDWRYRRMALHYAKLSVLAGGVDALLIGSELRGLTTLRSGAGVYPFVAGLRTLAADVRAIVGSGCKLSYAADWSEYFGHQPPSSGEGAGEVRFHLDAFWADANVDFVGVDLYHPLADWRDAPGHLDEASGRAATDHGYLRGNIRGGEGFDWYYASAGDRAAQIRTPITDGAADKPWVFRFKDLQAWWANVHYDRPGGTEAASPTAWVPMGKPIWLTELGCPAVDKGANQPNVFVDAKSADAALPYFSSGARDDLAQRSYIEAYQRFFDVGHPGFDGTNPLSTVYSGRMIPPEHLHVWAWDARPYPFFPERTDLWSDGPNWARGHWLNGRLGRVPVGGLIDAVLDDHGFAGFDASDVAGTGAGAVDGAVVNEVLSARETLEPILRAFRIDAADAGDRIRFRGRERAADAALEPDDLVEEAGEPLVTRRRAQETELPSELTVRFLDGAGDYRVTTATSRRLEGQSRRTSGLDLAAVLAPGDGGRIATALLRDVWTGREEATLALPPSLAAIEPGDMLTLASAGGLAEPFLAERIEDGRARSFTLRRVDNRAATGVAWDLPGGPGPETAPTFGAPEVRIIEFAPPDGSEAHAPRLAVFADPWPGVVAVHQAAEGGGFRLATTIAAPTLMGTLTAALPAGPLDRFDRGNAIEVEIFDGGLSSLPDIDVLNGGNAAAVLAGDGSWEVLQFAAAELTGERRYRLTKLLRGRCGTEGATRAGAAVGADFVLLDSAVAVLPVRADALGLPKRYRIGPARDDHAAPSYREITVTPEGRGLKPLAPVHLRAWKDAASGDVALRWIRRTRFSGDNWEAADVPLNEAGERYRVEIAAGGTVRRRVETATPAFLYPAADRVADLDSATAFEVSIAQLSAIAGAGFPLMETVHV